MPPSGSQGSRSGLVAAVVVFTILFVTATIFAIYYGVQESQTEQRLTTLNRQYQDIIGNSDWDNPNLVQVENAAKSDPALAGGDTTAVAELLRQVSEMRHVLVGANGNIPNNNATALAKNLLTAAQSAVAIANKNLVGGGQTIDDTDNLVQAISSLTSEISALTQNLSNAVTQRDAALADENTYKQSVDADSATLKATVAQLQQQVATLDNDKQQLVAKTQQQLASMQATFDDQQKSAAAQLQQAEVQRIELTTKMDTLNKLNEEMRQKLHMIRVNTDEPVVRRHEGYIAQLADAKTVYINLGRGDQIFPGMTFEVYDKGQPLPHLGDVSDQEDMPVGKGSIEVTDVMDGTSRCYIDHLEPGEHLVVGDPIFNIVYDPNTKFKFFVYGNFDFSQRVPKQTNNDMAGFTAGDQTDNTDNTDAELAFEAHRPSPAAGDLIKGLIVQFGGQVENHLGVDTDFVVIGEPPTVEIFTPDELRDPLKQQQLANEKIAEDNYDKVVNTAKDLGIPIMNQNRFLYFIGFYDLAPLAAK